MQLMLSVMQKAGGVFLERSVKKTEQTSKVDIELGLTRYKALLSYRKEKKYDKKD